MKCNNKILCIIYINDVCIIILIILIVITTKFFNDMLFEKYAISLISMYFMYIWNTCVGGFSA